MMFIFLVGSMSVHLSQAQVPLPNRTPSGLPLSITVFSESISLPTLAHLQKGGIGVKIGTELYYRNRPGAQTFQSINLGYYHHPGVQSGLFVSSEVGYRHYFGAVYADASLGVGALLLHPVAPSYERSQAGYPKSSAYQLKFMPSAGLGAGYRFRNRASVFTRYELFGEMPFSQILLPHQAIHVGARVPFLTN